MTLKLEPDDQPRAAPVHAGRGAIRQAVVAGVESVHDAGTVYTVADTVTVQYRGCTLTFRDGVAYPLHDDLKNFLALNGIAVTPVSERKSNV